MAFGKKGTTAPINDRSPRSTRQRSPSDETEASGGTTETSFFGSPLFRQLGLIGVGVLIAFALMVAHYSMMRGMGRDVEAAWNAKTGPIGWSTIVPGPHEQRTDMQRRLADLCLVQRSIKPSKGASEAFKYAVSLGRGHVAQLVTVGDYLVCTIERSANRFCSPDERRAFSREIQAFLSYRVAILRDQEERRAMAPNHGHFPQMLDFAIIADRDTLDREEENLGRIGRALHLATEAGYLSAADLRSINIGALAPHIAPLLEIKSTEKPCA
jgi:hypothetical protein